MARKHWQSMRAFVADLFTNRSMSEQGFKEAAQSSITALAEELDDLKKKVTGTVSFELDDGYHFPCPPQGSAKTIRS